MPRTYQCYDCGRTVPDTEVTRRNITTYGSSGKYIRTNSRRVNLCPQCYDRHAANDRRNTRIALVVLAAIAVVVAVSFALQGHSLR